MLVEVASLAVSPVPLAAPVPLLSAIVATTVLLVGGALAPLGGAVFLPGATGATSELLLLLHAELKRTGQLLHLPHVVHLWKRKSITYE